MIALMAPILNKHLSPMLSQIESPYAGINSYNRYLFLPEAIDVTFTPLIISQLSNLRFIQVYIDELNCRRTMGLAWHKKFFMSQAAKEFIQFSKDFFTKSTAIN
jgi:hypothetical protein